MLKEKDNYYRGANCKYKLTVHICLVVKYRKKLLIGKLAEDMKEILTNICEERDWYLQILETDKDHIHILLDYKSFESVSDIIHDLKQISTYRIWLKYESYLKKEFWKHRIFWSSGWFGCSIGDASNETIRKYIENQG